MRSRNPVAPAVWVAASLVAWTAPNALAQAPGKVIGNVNRVVTGTTARAIVNPPSADRRAATVLRLPFVIKPVSPPAPTQPAPTPTNPATPSPAPTPAPVPAVFEPRFVVDRFGLLWAPAKHSFEGTVRIFIIDTLHPTKSSQPLPDGPVTFQLTADGASIAPEAATISKSNQIESIVVSTTMRVDSIRMHVVPVGLDAPADVGIAVTMVPLDITLADTMPGFGLGRAEVAVALPPGSDGDSVTVHLQASHGSVSPEDIWVGPNRPGRAVFHSGGMSTGSLTAKAMGTGFGEAHADVAYAWPIGFTVAALFGVLLGGLGTMAFKKLAWTRANVFAAFVGGFVAGLVVSVAGSLLGVRIGNIDPGAGGGLALVFVLAAIGALLGSQAMRYLVPGADGSTSGATS
jgi:hypothetical protein